MPFFDVKCCSDSCNHEFETFCKFDDLTSVVCEKCGSSTVRLFTVEGEKPVSYNQVDLNKFPNGVYRMEVRSNKVGRAEVTRHGTKVVEDK